MGWFKTCLPYIRREEGGNDDDPHDHGGRTSRGITQREYDADRASRGLPSSDVWLATDAEIDGIYLRQYWQPYCDDLPPGLNLVFFDFDVNAGRQQAVKALQRALGINADGMFGLVTKQALANCQNIGGLIHDYSEHRRAFYRALKQFPRYGHGWLARVDRIDRVASGMVGAPYGVSSPKAAASEPATPMVSPEAGAAAATSSTVGVGIMDQIQQATQQIAPLQDSINVVKYLLIAVALIAFAVTIYGVIHRRRTQEAIG